MHACMYVNKCGLTGKPETRILVEHEMEYECSIVKERGREGLAISLPILMIRPPNSLQATRATGVWGLYRRFHDRVRILM